MKTLLVALMALCAAGTAHAQYTYQTLPNGAGGSITYGPGGQTWQTMPNGTGGAITYGPGGSTAQTLPNGAGGYNTYINRPQTFCALGQRCY